MSRLFLRTLRDDPANAEMPSHRLLIRAGYIRPLGPGIYSLLPLGFRVFQRVQQVIREEMDRIGGQEMEMPVVHPAELWKATGRWGTIGSEMARFRDRSGRDMVLAMTHEEVVADLVGEVVGSYRQLPLVLYHFQTKFCDEPRVRGGLMRVREFVMKDSYSCDLDMDGLDESYRKHHDAYERIFERLGLEAISVASDVGVMGGLEAHEFMVLNSHGEDVLVLCERCDFAANRQVARVGVPERDNGSPLPIEETATPGASTIERLSAFLKVDRAATAKATFFVHGRCPWGPQRQRDQAGERLACVDASAGARTGDTSGRDGAWLRVAHRSSRHRSRG
jgi:prolyl-tRNA synthetase